MQKVIINAGTYRNKPIEGVEATLLRPIRIGAKGWFGNFEIPGMGIIRVQLPNEEAITVLKTEISTPEEKETDEQIMERIRSRFEIFSDVVHGVAQGDVRSLIVSGAPGIGKTETIIRILEDEKKRNAIDYNIVKGSIVSAFQLYQTMYENSTDESVLILDDCDMILGDMSALNLLKAGLESGVKPRMITYQSQAITNLGLPEKFEFKGRMVFITNMDFQQIVDQDRKSIAKHYAALISRSLYLDLTLRTPRDIWCRMYDLVKNHGMLSYANLSDAHLDELLLWSKENHSRIRLFSLRTAIHLAEFIKTNPNKWHNLAETFLIKNV